MLGNYFKMLLLTGVFFGLTAVSGFAQELPCFERLRGQTESTKFKRNVSEGLCLNRRTPRRLRDNIGTSLTISGHITHQNGVRMSGITMTLMDLGDNTSRVVVSDDTGFYSFNNLTFGARLQLTPSRESYTFYPPAWIWEGIVEDEIANFIAVGPPPSEPPEPPGTPVLAWTSYYDGASHSWDQNAMLGRDAAGNVYLGGTTVDANGGDQANFALTKTDVNGNLLWSRTVNGTANYDDVLRDMAVDAAGNIYMTGYSYGLPVNGNLNSYDFLTVKYNTDGNLLWSKIYGKTDGYDDFPRSLKIDAAGNVYVAGSSWDIDRFSDFATLKYDTNGNLLWARRFSTFDGEAPDEVEVDPAGNVYVTGTAQTGPSENLDFLTIKYNSDGVQQWLNRYDSPNSEEDEGYKIEVNSAGDVYVLGNTYSYYTDFIGRTVIQKINGAAGGTRWVREYSITNEAADEIPTAMELDGGGNIVVAGMTNLTDEFYNVDAFVEKFDPEGIFQWLRTYDGLSDEDFDGDTKLALDAGGNVYMGATSEGFANPDMQLIKYTAAGAEVWRYRFGSPYFGYDAFSQWSVDYAQSSILLDATGNVYVAGESEIPDQASNLVAFKLEPVPELRAAQFDFDGDKKADIAVFRPATGVWYIINSSNGTYSIVNWGLQNDKLVPADYDGDGKYDLAVFRDGIWYVQLSSGSGYSITQFGLAGDIPVPADFDNDGRADLGVFRLGIWHQLTTSNNEYKAFHFGLASDVPIPSDYDRNRRSDVAVYRDGVWYVQYQAELPINSLQFGINTDKPVPADYDGDGQTDYAVFRQGVWYVWQSRTVSLKAFQWGTQGDIPVPADYDGDKKTDFAVFRGGIWYIHRSSDQSFSQVTFGLPDDIPIESLSGRTWSIFGE